MGDLTKNISRHELDCCDGCGSDTIDFETINVVQECCDHFAKQLGIPKVTLVITSANRCLNHNTTVGSNSRSYHPKGRALDIVILEVGSSAVYDYLDKKYAGKYGIGYYDSFTHIDTRTNGPSRWEA